MSQFEQSKLGGFFNNPNTMDRLGAIGLVLSNLDQGKVTDLSNVRQGIKDRAAFGKMMANNDLMAKFTPEERQMLAQSPVPVAQKVIAERLFAQPKQSKQTALLQAYKLAQEQGYEGDIIDYQKELMPERDVNTPVPVGYELHQDPETGNSRMVVIPGGPADIQNKQNQKEAEEKSVQKQKEFDQIQDQYNSLIDSAKATLTDPGLDSAVGVKGAFTQYMGAFAPESARARSKIDQLSGGVFLQAYERLKGSGQITEIEGQKAERALARLDASQSPDDFREALNEFITIIETAKARHSGNTESQPKRYVFDPSTGKFQ